MPETIKRITANDLDETLTEWNKIHVGKTPNFFIVNSIDIMDFLTKSLKTRLTKNNIGYVDGSALYYKGIRIIRSDDIQLGEIYVV